MTTAGGFEFVSSHVAEPWRQGYGRAVRFGWWCLTCDDEGDSPAAEDAISEAAEHMTAYVPPHPGSPA